MELTNKTVLVKFAEKEEYLTPLKYGNLRFKSIEYYNQFSNSAGELVGDNMDGVLSIKDTSRLSFYMRPMKDRPVGPITFTEKDRINISSMSIKSSIIQKTPICCFTILSEDDIEIGTDERGTYCSIDKKVLRDIRDSNFPNYNYYAIIPDAYTYLNILREAALKKGIAIEARCIKYDACDNNAIEALQDELKALEYQIFRKEIKYSKQKEIRFFICNKTLNNKNDVITLGNLIDYKVGIEHIDTLSDTSTTIIDLK